MSNVNPDSGRGGQRPRSSLSASLLAAFLALTLIPIGAITAFSAIAQSRRAQDTAYELLTGVAEIKQQQLEEWIDTTESSLKLNLTNEPSYEDALVILTQEGQFVEPAREGFAEHATLFLEPSGAFDNIMLATPQGQVVFSSNPRVESWDVSPYPFFAEGSIDDAISAPFQDPLDSQWSIYFLTPVFDESGTLAGVLIGRTPITVLENLAGSRTGLGETGEVLFVTVQRRYLTSIRYGDQRIYAESQGIARALQGEEGRSSFADYRGEQVLGVYRWVSDLQIAMVVEQDQSEALAGSRVLVQRNILAAIVAAIVAIAAGIFYSRRITRPIVELTETATRIAGGDRSLRAATFRDDELGSLAGAFNEMTVRVDELVGTLEGRVARRTRDLEITAEISRAISAVRNLDVLMGQITELISQRYNYYHVQVFLVDDVREFAVLHASMGEAGRQLLERGHKLAVASQGVVGRAAQTGKPVAAHDTDTSVVHRFNPLLPETRSELALPLRIGTEVIGVLDVQSKVANAFDADTIELLQTVADQLAIAINNARLFEEAQALLAEQEQVSKTLTRTGWDEYASTHEAARGFTYDLSEVRELDDRGNPAGNAHSLPIELRGAVIGELSSEGDINEEDRLLVEAVAERVGLALENARLFEEANRRALELDQRTQRLALLNQISSDLATLDMRSILSIAIERLATAIGADQGSVALMLEDKQNLRVEVSYPPNAPSLRTIIPIQNNPSMQEMASTFQPVVINNVAADERVAAIRDTLAVRNVKAMIIVPLVVGGELIGTMGADFTGKARKFDEEQISLAQTIANQVAVSISNARLFVQTQESLDETSRLYEAGRSIVEAGDLEDLFAAAIRSSIRDWVDRVTIGMINDPETAFDQSGGEIRAQWNRKDGEEIRHLTTAITFDEMPLVGRLDAGVLAISNVNTDGRLTEPEREALLAQGHNAGIYMPLRNLMGQMLGWLMVANTRDPLDIPVDWLRYYQSIADQIGIALDSHRLFEEAEQRAIKLQATNVVSQAATSILDIDALLPQIVDLIRDSFNYYHAQVFMVDEASGMAILRASTGEVGARLIEMEHKLAVGSRSVIGKVTSEGVPVIARDVGTDVVHRPNPLLPDTRAEMAIPLKHGARVVGALDVQSTRRNAFTEEDITILQTLADQIAVALENAQLFQDIQERVAELTTVNLISQEVSHARTLDDLFETARNQMLRAFEADDGFLALHNRANDEVTFPIYLLDGKHVSVAPQKLEPGPIARVIETGFTTLVNEDAQARFEEMGGVSRRMENVKSWLGVPLTIGNEVIGVLAIQNLTHELAYDDGHQRMLSTLAAYLAVAVRNAQLFDETEQRVAELGFLFDMTSTAVASPDLNQTLQRIAESLRDEMEGAEATIVALMDSSKEFLVPRAASGYGSEIVKNLGEQMIPVRRGLAGWAAREGKAVLVGDVRQDPRYVQASERTRSEVVVPLMVGAEVVGVVLAESSQLNAFDDGALRLLQTLSGTLSAIIENARLLNELEDANTSLRELDKLRSQFLANMSHELRTPLNSIIGFSRVILKGIDGPLTDLQEQDLSTIHSSGQHLLGLINDILDSAKIDAGKMDLTQAYTDLREVFESVMATATALVKGKPLELVLDLPEEGLPETYIDAMRIRQVLLNLLSNAAKFTNEGSITLRARVLEPEGDMPEMLRVAVVDTGIGIAHENMEKLFQAFSQVDSSTTRVVGGTGLGLIITRSLIELHGGEMWVESELEKGSTFGFTIPVHPLPDGTQEFMEQVEDTDRPIIIAIDDDEGVIKLYKRFLEKEGYTVIGMDSSAAVLDTVRQLQPLAIMLDIMMPGRDGWQVIADLKQADETRDIPVIMCSIVEDRERGFNLGAADYLVKPILEDDLLTALERISNGSANRNVLIIDDEVAFINLMREILELTGSYDVRTAVGGTAGVDAAVQDPPDLILLDLSMPDIDGFVVLEQLQDHETTRDVPVLIMTGKELAPEDYDRLPGQVVSMIAKGAYSREELLEGIAVALAGI